MRRLGEIRGIGEETILNAFQGVAVGAITPIPTTRFFYRLSLNFRKPSAMASISTLAIPSSFLSRCCLGSFMAHANFKSCLHPVDRLGEGSRDPGVGVDCRMQQP